MNARQAWKICHRRCNDRCDYRRSTLIQALSKLNALTSRKLFRKQPITIHFPDGSKIEFIGQFQRRQPLVYDPYETAITIEVVDV